MEIRQEAQILLGRVNGHVFCPGANVFPQPARCNQAETQTLGFSKSNNLFQFSLKQPLYADLPLHFMRILFLGDIVGKPGYSAVLRCASVLRSELRLDALIANAENASDGSGLMPRQFKRLMEAGIDAVTMGDHIYKCRDIIPVLKQDSRIVKPANYPADASGRTWTVVKTSAGPIGVVSLMGRVFMRPVDCPMTAADRVLEEIQHVHPQLRHILVDVHAEATSDKQTIARYLDGRVTAVIGTHTHVPTADLSILPGGTAFQCDAGMCGPYFSIIGRDIQRVTSTTVSFEPVHFHVATGDVRLCGVLIEADADGKATAVDRFERQAEDFPEKADG